MNIDEMTKLIKAVADNKLTSFEIKDGEFKLSIKCEKETPQIVTVAAPVAAPMAAPGVVAAPPVVPGVAVAPAVVPAAAPGAVPGVVAPAAPAASGVASGEEFSGNLVTAPLVGTFYSASSPDAEPFVKEGDTVKKGQVLGIIEAMKLMNEIESEYDGVVEAVLVGNEEVVEYGQPLFRIR